MQFYEVIENRKSIKHFKRTPIDKEKLSKMVKAVMMAPSWKNNTSYRLILVDDEHKKERLAQSVMNDTDESANAIRQAPLAAVIVSNPDESGFVEGRPYYLVDSAIAMEHLVLAATNEGYGTCWIGAFDEDKVREALSIPASYRVVAMTPIGEVAEEKGHNPIKNISDYVFINNWENGYENNTKFPLN